MKNFITLFSVTTLFLGNAFAQSDAQLERDAKKKIVNTSKQEWKDAMALYEADMDQNRRVTIEIEFLKYKSTLFDQPIKNAEDRRAKYEAILNDPNETVRKEAQTNLDRLNTEITDLKLQKADSEAVAAQFEKDSAGSFKSVAEIDAELNKTQEIITTRLAPFKASGGEFERLGYVFLHEDMKYKGTHTKAIAEDSDFQARKALNKKYPPQGMFRSEVTNFYAQRGNSNNSDLAKNNKNKTEANTVAQNYSTASNANTAGTTTSVTTVNNSVTNTTPAVNIPTTVNNGSSVPSGVSNTTPVNNTQTVEQPVVTQTAVNTAVDTDAKRKVCEDAALKEVYRIISNDKNNAFAKMYELTVMKLAKKTLESKNKTLEGYTNSKIAELQTQLNASKDSADTQKKVADAYETFGKAGDLNAVIADLDKSKGANYKSARMWNEQTSSYVLAASIVDPNSGLKDSDAAIIWAVEKIRLAGDEKRFGKNKEEGNLLNTSTRVTRYLGTAKDSVSETVKSLDAKITAQNKEIESLIQSAYNSTKTSLVACLKEANPNCADCANQQLANFEKDSLGLEKIQRGLASSVAKGENAKLEKYLKGKAGDVSFDFNKTLAKINKTNSNDSANTINHVPYGQGACPLQHKVGVHYACMAPESKKSDLVYTNDGMVLKCMNINFPNLCPGASPGTYFCCDDQNNIGDLGPGKVLPSTLK